MWKPATPGLDPDATLDVIGGAHTSRCARRRPAERTSRKSLE